MNQAASATRRAPADSTVSAGGCCPMLNAPLFSIQTPSCYLPPLQTRQQLVQLLTPPQQQTVSQRSSNLIGQQQQQQQQHQQQQQQQQLQAQQPQHQSTQRSHTTQTSNHHSTSLSAHNFSMQQTIANRQAAQNCAAITAAAFASYISQLPRLTQNHQAAPINHHQPTQTVAPNATVTQSNTSSTFTSQVPLTNFNSYSTAQQQPFISSTGQIVPQQQQQQTPPAAAHLNQQQTNLPNNSLISNLDPNAQPAPPPASLGTNNLRNVQQQQPRPLVTNPALNVTTGQLVESLYRSSQHQPSDQNVQQQPTSTTPSVTAPQHLGQPFRTPTLLDDALIHSLFLQQILADSQSSAPAPGPTAPQLQGQQQQITTSQQMINTSTRAQSTALPLSSQLPVVMTPAQQVTSTQITLPSQQQQERPSEQVSDNQQQQPQVFQQPRTNHQPTTHPHHTSITNDHIQNLVSSTAGNPSLSQANTYMHLSGASPAQALQAHQSQPPPPPTLQPPQVPVLFQGIQPPLGLGLQHNQNLTDLVSYMFANPQMFANFISTQISRIVEQYQQFPVHHYHQHLHSTHHHHHGQNGQANGQDASMPLDSLAMNESKPRGLSRAEIDSLTPYMHTNEKDARTCVICLSKFELKSKIRPLPCNHAFHAKCVDKWLRTNRTCPICRRDALKTLNGKIKRI